MGVMKKIYIAGKITGVPDYKAKFKNVETLLTLDGHVVLNPAIRPDNLDYESCMYICLAMISVCDAIYLMPCWKKSPGARREHNFARTIGKEIIYG